MRVFVVERLSWKSRFSLDLVGGKWVVLDFVVVFVVVVVFCC